MSFEFSPAAVPQAPVQVDDSALRPSRPVAPQGSDDERIEAARAICIQSIRQSANSDFGRLVSHSPAYVAAYFQEWAGKPSCWLAGHLYFLAELIGTQMAGKPLPIGGDESYNGATGTFASLGGFSFDALLEAYRARIAELGISEAALEEWNVQPRDWRESNAFYARTFDERMDIFRAKA